MECLRSNLKVLNLVKGGGGQGGGGGGWGGAKKYLIQYSQKYYGETLCHFISISNSTWADPEGGGGDRGSGSPLALPDY